MSELLFSSNTIQITSVVLMKKLETLTTVANDIESNVDSIEPVGRGSRPPSDRYRGSTR